MESCSYSVMRTRLETWERENPDLERHSCESTIALSSGESECHAARSMSARQGLEEKLDMLTCASSGYKQVVQEGRLILLSAPTSENLSGIFTEVSQVDADFCYECKNFHEKRWKWTTSNAGKHVNELQTINDDFRLC